MRISVRAGGDIKLRGPARWWQPSKTLLFVGVLLSSATCVEAFSREHRISSYSSCFDRDPTGVSCTTLASDGYSLMGDVFASLLGGTSVCVTIRVVSCRVVFLGSLLY